MMQNAINQVKAFLPNTSNVTEEQIRSEVDFVLRRPEYAGLDKELLIRELKTQYTLVPEGFRIIELNDPERKKPWIKAKRSQLDFPFWNRYKNYLLYRKGFAPPVVEELDGLTDRIMDGLYDPSLNVGFDKKGLVVGQVQSGKTSNYTGLVCKAADSGYNLIIIMAGLHNNLRSQTQLRIDEGFLGFDTQFQRAFNTGQHLIGVGAGNTGLPAHSLTDSSDNGDFSRRISAVSFSTREPIIAVVKKNSTVLKHLQAWLGNHTTEFAGKKIIHDKAVLIIDDEADNASINTKKNPDERTAINAAIRDILSMFAKNAYVGYTATPFANIFIPSDERENLFPRDFIVNIPPPPNYIGPDKIFGFDFHKDDDEKDSDVLPICFRIDGNPAKLAQIRSFPSSGTRQNSPLTNEIPETLKTAVKCFIITCAVRILRGQGTEHNSMLVHVARFMKWQEHVKDLVQEVFVRYKHGIDYSQADILQELQDCYEKDRANYHSYQTVTDRVLNSDYAGIDNGIRKHNWEEVQPHLYAAVLKIKIRVINGSSGEVLDYYDNRDTGLSVIAVGGDKLSRGLTLEGLSVSYYLRASKMYDTLMQMGRWFGYRPGYADLCRLFTTSELNEWFCHITRATQELREEFDYMSEQANATPEKYALKVRTHPGVLQISAANKIRSAQYIDVSWAGRLVESYELQKNYDVNSDNYQSVKNLISVLKDGKYKSEPKRRTSQLWYDIPPELIVEFFRGFKVYENLKAYNPDTQIDFIEKQVANGELNNWRVALMSSNKSNAKKRDVNGYDVGMFQRDAADEDSTKDKYYIRKSHIIDKNHEAIDLTPDEIKRATVTSAKTGKTSISGEIIRKDIRDPQKPLLLLYLLDPEFAHDKKLGDDLNTWDIPISGYAISYPGSRHNAPVRYAISRTLLPYYNNDADSLEFDDDDE